MEKVLPAQSVYDTPLYFTWQLIPSARSNKLTDQINLEQNLSTVNKFPLNNHIKNKSQRIFKRPKYRGFLINGEKSLKSLIFRISIYDWWMINFSQWSYNTCERTIFQVFLRNLGRLKVTNHRNLSIPRKLLKREALISELLIPA